MQPIKLTIAALALVLSACAPSASTNIPAANTPDTALAADSATTTAPTPTDAVVAEVAAAETGTEVPTNAPAVSAPPVTTPTGAPTAVAVAMAQPQPQGPNYENLNSPVDLLASYYNAINRQEYQRAYGYWQTPPLDYQSFAKGYSDTSAIQVIVQPPTSGEGAAGSTYVQIPTVLIAQHTDATTHTYAGCFTTRKSNLHPPDIPKEDVWHIYQAKVEEVANNASIPALLAQGCAS